MLVQVKERNIYVLISMVTTLLCEHETSTYLHLHCASLHGIEPFSSCSTLCSLFTCLDKLELWLNDLLQILQTREAAIDNKMNHVAYIQRIFKSTRKSGMLIFCR